jgi:hypothetical protein
MPEIPPQAVQAAAQAITNLSCEHEGFCFECEARAALEAAAPFMACQHLGPDAPARASTPPYGEGKAVPRVVGSADDPISLEMPTALREEIARLDGELAAVRMQLTASRMALKAAEQEAEQVRLGRDAARASHRGQQGITTRFADTLHRVRELAEHWKHVADRKNGPLRELLAALDVPADGEQTPTPETTEEGNR